MAIFKSPIFSEISGSIAGATYFKGKSGLTVRARTTPVDPQSAAQVTARNSLSQASTAWSDELTQPQREAWTAYAIGTPLTNKLGDELVLSGQQMYVRCNQPRLVAGVTRIDDGPIVLGIPSIEISNFIAEASPPLVGNVAFVIDDLAAWANEDDAHLFVQVSRGLKEAVNFFKGPFRSAGTVDGDSTTAPPALNSINSPFVYNDGQRVFGRFTLSRADGRLGSALIFSDVVD